MKAAKGKGKRPNSAQQKSPSKKTKVDRKAQPSILSFFGKSTGSAATQKEEAGHLADCVSLDDDEVDDAATGSTRDDIEVIDLDGSEGDTKGSNPPGEDAVPCRTGDPCESPAKVIAVKCEMPSSASENSTATTRNLLKDNYDAEKDACWSRGQPAPFLHLARAFHLIENEKGRLKMRLVIGNMFRSILVLSPQDLLPAVYLTVGKIAPAHEGGELNVGGSTVADAVAEVAGVSKSKLGPLYAELGDLGDVAQALRGRQRLLVKPSPLGIAGVYQALRSLSKEAGGGSGARKKATIMGLLRGCREEETRYLVRTLIQNMRIGMNTTLVLGALAFALVMETGGSGVYETAGGADAAASGGGGGRGGGGSDKPGGGGSSAMPVGALPASGGQGEGGGGRRGEGAVGGRGRAGGRGKGKALEAEVSAAAKAMVEAYRECPNLDVLVKAMLEGGLKAVVQQCTVMLGVPLKPMLAKVGTGMVDALGKLEKRYGSEEAVLGEFKYDGQRAMLHVGEDGSFKAFSRNCEDCSGQYPDVQEVLAESAGGHSMVLDGELVAVDAEGLLRPFQELSRRKRGEVAKEDVDVKVCVFVFDLLVLDGRSLVRESLRERRRVLREAMPRVAEAGAAGAFRGRVEFAKAVEVRGGAEGAGVPTMEQFLLQSLDEQCEGLVVKALGQPYEPGKRSDAWLKVKKDYVEGLADTLDLIPIGAWNGNGRKAGWLSPWLMAVQDPESGELQSVCRIMSGFTDDFYKKATQRFLPQALPAAPSYYATRESPSYWFPASEVWECRGAEVTESPVHMGAVHLTAGERGLAIRFPRFLRVREDKGIDDASTPQLILDLFQKQSNRSGPRRQAGAREEEEEEEEDGDGDPARGASEEEEEEEEDRGDREHQAHRTQAFQLDEG